MEDLLVRAIEREARKRISKYSRERYQIHRYRRVYIKRTGKPAKGGAVTLPSSWNYHKQFDPRYCLNHSRFLARGIWTALRTRSYKPIPSLRVDIAKAGGGIRTIDIFGIPDAALAKVFLDRLRLRNAKIFSDSSYAYHHYKTPFDAVIRLQSALKSEVAFISQYDFSAYFDSIEHSYLLNILSKEGPFLTTKMERYLLHAILTHEYRKGAIQGGIRACGTPQGNSLSLFLANVAAHPLDQELDRLSGTFARFADDSVVINTSYEDALRTADAFRRFSKTSGVKINALKSRGIRMFSDVPMEMAHISEFEFLGYIFKPSGLYMGSRAKSNIKRRCSKIIYNNLLLHLKRSKSLNNRRLGNGFHDWDLVTCINELRKYIYGGLTQAALEESLLGTRTIRNVSGAVSYFALVENSEIFRELDGWLVDVLHRGYRARLRFAAKLLNHTPNPVSKNQLIDGTWYSFPKIPVDTRLPSFFSAWRAARKSWSQHGLGGIDPLGMGYTYL